MQISCQISSSANLDKKTAAASATKLEMQSFMKYSHGDSFTENVIEIS